MVEVAPQFETKDDLGSTTQFASTVGTTPVQVPASAGTKISEILIRCETDNTPVTKRLLWSLDNVTYHALAPGEFIGWEPQGTILQIYLKGNTSGVAYEVVMNREL